LSGYSQVKGITVKINGDTTGLQKALNNVKAQTAGLDKTMSKLKSSMKLNPGDYQSFATYQDLLKDKIKSTTKQLEIYNQAVNKYPKTQTEWSKAVGSAKSELVTYQSALKSTESEIKGIENAMEQNNTQISEWTNRLSSGGKVAKQAQTSIDALRKSNSTYSSQLSTATNRQAELTEAIASQKTELKNLGATYEESQQTLHGLQGAQATCKNQLVNLTSQFVSTNSTVLKTVHVLDQVSQKANSFANAIKPLSTVSAVALAASAAAAISFEDAWTGVTKTVSGTPSQLQKVNDGLKELATTTASSYQDIASYAEIAGQMGVQTENVVEFTKTITMLGDTTNLVGEEAAQALAKFANIMQGAGTKSNEYYSRLGSTIVDLGNKFATTESDITEMSERLAVGAKQVGINEQGVLALSTALSSLGIKAEAGGSSVSKVLKTIESQVKNGGEYLEEYAKVAGMTAEEFASAWENDALGTFVKVIQGIGNSADGVTVTLEKLGITSIRQSQSIAALAQSSDVLTSAITTANSAWSLNTAMTDEAEKRYATLKSQLSQTWEALKQAGNELGQALTPTITSIAKGVKKAAQAFSNLDDSTQETVAKILLFTAAAYPAAKAISKISSSVKTAIEHFGGFVGKIGDVRNAIAGATGSFTGANILLGGLGTAAALAAAEIAILVPRFEAANKKALENATKNDAVAQSYVKLADSMSSFNKKIDEYMNKADESIESYESQKATADNLVTTIKQLNDVENLSSVQKQMLKEAVSELNAIYPDLGLTIDEATGKIADNTGKVIENYDELDNWIAKVQEAAKQEAYADAIKQQTKALIKQKTKYSEVSTAVEGLNEKMDTLKEKQSKAMDENDNEKVLKYQTQIEQLKKKYDELTSSLGTMSTKMQENQKSLLDYTNEMETGGLTTIGQTLKDSLQGCIDKATEAGVQIPTQLTEGIMNGTESYQNASNFVASMLTFQELEQSAGEAGLSIPSTLAYQIIANAGSVTEAVNMLNNLMEFNEAALNAGIDASQIDPEIASAIADGSYPVDQACTDLADGGLDALKEGYSKYKEEASTASKETGDALGDGESNASASGKNMGESSGKALVSSYKQYADEAIQYAEKTKAALEDAVQFAKDNPIVITKKTVVESETKNVSKQSLDSISQEAVALADTLTDTQPLALPNSVDTAYISSRTIADSSIRSSARVDALSSKLDSFIDAFMSANLTINLQPMELDGGVITDVVQETISIRELLSSWGKGGS
jgi:TP901 family phage tail tape measure protein